MSMTDELERLARLHAAKTLTDEEFARAKARLLAGGNPAGFGLRGIRRQSSRSLWGRPLWAVAFGPDWERGELRGHARGIFAFGDLATGWVACGGLARGIFAFGGLAVGVFAFGGAAIGALVAVGGGAVGAIAAGGGAIGLVAVGGGALGYFALGGGAEGAHVVSALRQDPEAVAFFREYLPRIAEFLPR
jgi:hypothetical protein